MTKIDTNVIGKKFGADEDNGVDNQELIVVNELIRGHLVEEVGAELRAAMTAMVKI